MKSIKTATALFFLAALVATVAGTSYGYPPFVAKARKFGAKDCTFCHVDPLGGPPWNERGQWLIDEKERLKADVVDIEWLASFKPGKAGNKMAVTDPASSQKPSGPQQPTTGGTVEQQVSALLDQLIDAAKRRDFPLFASILADDYSEITPEGAVVTKAALIQDLPNYNLESYSRSEIATRVLGDVAIMTLLQSSKGSYKGQEVSGNFRETIVWAKRDGNWRMVAAHVTRVAP